MNNSGHDFVTVDMRGLKAALVAHARASRVTVSFAVRGAVAMMLKLAQTEGGPPLGAALPVRDPVRWVKLSIRVTPTEAQRFDAGAVASGLSRGAYIVGLADRIPALSENGLRQQLISSLVESNGELSKLSRNVHQLTALLRQGNVQQALVYRKMLDSLAADVHRHLRLSANGLTQLQVRGVTRRQPSDSST